MTEFAIDVSGLKKTFGNKTVVNGISIQMPKGQVWGFLGPNGSGKTTTIRMMCGLLTPSAGSGRCLGYDIVKQSSEIKKQTGYMTQKFSFWEDLSIRENLYFVARMYNLKDKAVVVSKTIDKLGLKQRQNQLAGALSGGWKQRLALAAVTMHQPRLLLLDEPTAGVDPQARREFWDEIHQLTNQGMTVLVSTHYMDEAERCDEIAYLANGYLVTQGKVKDVIAQSNLITYVVSGNNVRSYAQQISQYPGVENASYFGSALHVSGSDASMLSNITKDTAFRALHWQRIDPNLEDVFISLMKESGEDRRNYA